MFYNGNCKTYNYYGELEDSMESLSPYFSQIGCIEDSVEKSQEIPMISNLGNETRNDRLIKDPKISSEELQVFLTEILHNQFNLRDKNFLLDLENIFIEFISQRIFNTYSFPPMGSYHRMLVHRVASYFNLGHYADDSGRFVIVQKISTTKCPELLLSKISESVKIYSDDQIIKPKLIIKRQTNSAVHSSNHFDNSTKNLKIIKARINAHSHGNNNLVEERANLSNSALKTLEQREEEYQKARARIFNEDRCDNKDSNSFHKTAVVVESNAVEQNQFGSNISFSSDHIKKSSSDSIINTTSTTNSKSFEIIDCSNVIFQDKINDDNQIIYDNKVDILNEVILVTESLDSFAINNKKKKKQKKK